MYHDVVTGRWNYKTNVTLNKKKDVDKKNIATDRVQIRSVI